MRRLWAYLAAAVLAATTLTQPAEAAPPAGPPALQPCRSGLVWHNAAEVTELFMMGCDGVVHQLTHTPPGQGGVESPRWGRHDRVYFDSDFAGAIHVFRMKAVTDAPYEQLTVTEGFEFSPDPTPNGRQVVFEHASADFSQDGLFVIPDRPGLAESSFRQLTASPFTARGGFDTAPDVSPNGRTVAFIRVKDPTLGSATSAVFTVRMDGSHLRRLTPYALNAINPRWSPDGHELLFSSHGDSASATVSADLFVMDDNGGHRRNLTREPARSHSFLPAWSPNGQHIVYTHAAPDQPSDQIVLGRVGRPGTTVLYTGPAGVSASSVDWR